MWDFLTALLGGKHCGWCTDKPDGKIMHYFDGTGPRKAQPPLRRAFWLFMDFNYRLRIWRLGQMWHFRFHDKETR